MHIIMIGQPNTTITLALIHIYVSLLKFIFFAFYIHSEDLNKHIVCSVSARSLRLILHRPQRPHNVNRRRLTGNLLKLWISNTHENVVLFLIANREFALRLLVLLRKSVKFLDRIVVKHSLGEFYITLCVLVSGEDFGVIWEGGKCFVQGFVHLLGVSFKEAAASANEQCISCEYGTVVAVFEVEADAVLGVAWCVKCLHIDGADVEGFVVARRSGDFFAVTSANYRQVESFELRCELGLST